MPEDVSFQTKPRLARRMLERALESGVPFGWVTGDAVYGSDRKGEDGTGLARELGAAGTPPGKGTGLGGRLGGAGIGLLWMGGAGKGPGGNRAPLAAGPPQSGQPRNWPITSASARLGRPWRTGEAGGPSRNALRRPRARWAGSVRGAEMGRLVPALTLAMLAQAYLAIRSGEKGAATSG